jgi:fimbrial chaperone protein
MRHLIVALLVVFLSAPATAAGALRVTPITLSLAAPAMATTLTLENAGDRPVNVQMRTFRWSQTGGRDILVPTQSVVVSPPVVQLAPGGRQTVRVLRIERTPAAGVESYRVLIDQLPPAGRGADGRVAFMVRQSVPLFYASADASGPRIEWRVSVSGGRIALAATNTGDTPVKVANPMLDDAGGGRAVLSDGLLGYVLGGSAMRWTIEPPSGRLPRPGAAKLSLRTDAGVVNVPVTIRPGG